MRIFLLILTGCFIIAGTAEPNQKKFTKAEIFQMAERYLTAAPEENPVFVDLDTDGDFDVLHFNDKGFVEHFKNTGSNEHPLFELVTDRFDDYEIHSILGAGLPCPAFMADADGDGDADMFAITGKKGNAASNVELVENQFEVTQGLLITIILVLGIIALLIYIL